MKNFSSTIFSFILDISKNLILSIYFLIQVVIFSILFFFYYVEFVLLTFFNKSSNFNSVIVYFLSSSNVFFSKISDFYLSFLNFLQANELQKTSSDVIIFVTFVTFMSSYFITGSASVSFSNEGLWLSILSLAVLYLFCYLSALEKSGQNVIVSEVEALKLLMLKNSTLVSDISELEIQILSFQEKTFEFLLFWFTFFDSIACNFDSDDNLNSTVFQTTEVVNKIFNESFNDYIDVELSREVLNQSISVRDLNEEVISEIFENNN